MSLATRCPACGTIFRVVQDQLKVSEGWVRCGQCHEVFHGIEALFDLDSDPAIAARRAAARNPGMPPPTRVFADQRASAPIPIPTQTPAPPAPAPSPVVFPTRPSAPVTTPPGGVRATPSAFGSSGPSSAPLPIRPGYTGFTPAPRAVVPEDVPAPAAQPVEPPPAPARHPIPGFTTRATIAPRFAARLAEESARAQAAAAGLAPPPAATPIAPVSAPVPLADTPPVSGWQALTMPMSIDEPAQAPIDEPLDIAPIAPEPPAAAEPEPEPRSAPAPAPEPAPEPEPSFIPRSLLARPPQAEPPTRVDAELPLVTPIPMPGLPSYAEKHAEEHAEDLAAAFAAPESVPASEIPDDAEIEVIEPAPSVGISTIPSMLADDAADEARAGPPTLASMLPEDAGEWPPRKTKKRKDDGTSSELALVDRSKDPRFLREARSGARWRNPWVRAGLGLALLALVAGAVGQVAWPMRDALAARWPSTRPAWDWLCEQADCSIEAPRAIASLALDGSSLTRTDTEHVLLFSADLHNRADHEVRMPSFDVTFMDLNGEIVARKVLTPAQLGIRQAALPPEGELHVHARLQVGSLPASGFQADLFYP